MNLDKQNVNVTAPLPRREGVVESLLEKSAKIYVAGHHGLVGSAIWNNLLQRGYTNLVGRSHQELDLLDGQAVKQFFDEERPDAVVLAAAHVGGIMANLQYRADFIWQNLQIQQNVIGESWRHGVKKLLFLGSTCIYPREAPQPMPEDSLLTSPLEYTNEPYAIAKIAGLKLCESFNLQYGTNYIAVMPTNLYGPNDNFHLENSHVLPAMIRKIHLAKCLNEGDWEAVCRDLERRPLTQKTDSKDEILAALAHYGITPDAVTLWGTGTPLREFLWSEEMADASVHVLLNVDFRDTYGENLNADGINEVRNCHINVGTGKEISIRTLAQLIQKEVGFRGEIRWDRSKPDGTLRKLTDVSKLHRLGWHHKIEIDEGVHRLYQWYLQGICINHQS
jgi:GDP-L-fucose synthase